MEYVEIPQAIVEQYQNLVLAVNVMFADGVPFMVSVARGINLITAEYTPFRTIKQLVAGVKQICQLYAHGQFKTNTLLMDNKFQALEPHLPGLIVNTTATRKHITDII